MVFSLRQLSRSRRLRAMGALAWLLLVVQSLTAMPTPVDMHQASHHGDAAHSVAMVMGASCHQHRAAVTSRYCCDGTSGGACSCAAMTSTTLPSTGLSVVRSNLAGVIYAARHDAGAPSVSHGPPFRPPAV